MSQLQSPSMAVRICKGDEQRLQARPQDYSIPTPSRVVKANGILHVGERGVARLTCQNISATVAAQIFADGTDGEGDVFLKELAATGGTPGLGSEMDLTPYSHLTIYVKGNGGDPSVTITKYMWDRAETARNAV